MVSKVVPVTGTFTKVGLAARDDGTFVLVGTAWDQNNWRAFQFSVEPSGQITSLGMARGTGHVLHDPIFSNVGMLLPVEDRSKFRMVDLAPALFSRSEKVQSL